MPITFDEYDQHVLKQSGKARELLWDLFGHKISSNNNARKYMAGIRVMLRDKREEVKDNADKENETIDYKSDGTIVHEKTVAIFEGEDKTPETIMQKLGYDPGDWEVVHCKTSAGWWNTTLNLDGRMDQVVNEVLRVELKVKPRKKPISANYMREIFENLQPPDLVKHEYNSEGLLFEPAIMDPHFGSLAWGEGTHKGDYDLKIADRLYRDTIIDLLGELKSTNKQVAQILLVVGQDFFHVDTPQNTTTWGTQLDHDTRWEKMYRVGVSALTWAVEQLRAIAPVKIIYIPGNHDEQLSYAAVYHLWGLYHDQDLGVTVDPSMKNRKFYEWGKVYLGFTHGHKLSKGKMEDILQVENPEIWGRTLFREMHFAHKHKQDLWESGGATYRRMAAITETDDWHYKNGFIGALRSAQGLLWSRERGLRHVLQSNIVLDYSTEMV